jgi:outer membrane receptor protein involved in Fe transport
VGVLENPAFFLVDLRVQYRRPVGQARLEVFADVFNVFDDQDAIREQDLIAGQGADVFGAGIRFNDPRRLFLGARLSF